MNRRRFIAALFAAPLAVKRMLAKTRDSYHIAAPSVPVDASDVKVTVKQLWIECDTDRCGVMVSINDGPWEFQAMTSHLIVRLDNLRSLHSVTVRPAGTMKIWSDPTWVPWEPTL